MEDEGLTVFAVEADLSLVLLLALQGLVHLLDDALAGLVPVQEAAGAHLLHHLRPHEAGQLAEAVRAVDDGVAVVNLSVPQEEVTVCRSRGGREREREATESGSCSILTTAHTNAAQTAVSEASPSENTWFHTGDPKVVHDLT